MEPARFEALMSVDYTYQMNEDEDEISGDEDEKYDRNIIEKVERARRGKTRQEEARRGKMRQDEARRGKTKK